MADKSKIEWTGATWNPVSGCTKLSPGCDNCYAERFAERWRGTPNHPYEQGFDLKLHEHRLLQPMKWRQPRFIFVNSMSDLFQKEVPVEFIDRVFDVMEACPQHVFQLLTKRSSIQRRYINARYHKRSCPAHIWLGVSVEDARRKSRVTHLQQTNATVRFLSIEPLLGAIPNLLLEGIHWVIVGGESGPRFRAMEETWARDIRDQCIKGNVPFFFKQWGGYRSKSHGRELDGREWNEMPTVEGHPLFVSDVHRIAAE